LYASGIGPEPPAIGDGTGFGNSGMGIILGPGQFNFSVLKNTRLFENQSLQFRAEFFNIFNHPQFDNPNPNSIPYQSALPNVSAPNFGHRGNERQPARDPTRT
jgi:hypothetical protein